MEAYEMLMQGKNGKYRQQPATCNKWRQDFRDVIRNGGEDFIKDLSKSGGNINLPRESGYTPLSYAVVSGDKEAVKCFLKNGAIPDTLNRDNMGPLHMAAELGRLEIAELLLEAGASIDICDASGSSVLRFAAKPGNENLVMLLLLQKGAVFDNRSSKNKFSILECALKNGWLEVLKFLADNGVDLKTVKPLDLVYKEKCHRDSVEFLINQDVIINYNHDLGRTMLHYAAIKRWSGVAVIALNKGLDVNAVTYDDFTTPILFACNFASGNATIPYAWYPVDDPEDNYIYNRFKSSNQIFDEPFECPPGHTPDQWISTSLEIVDILLEKGAKINEDNSFGETPLHLALNCFNSIRPKSLVMNLIGHLLKKGADCNIENCQKKSPFERFVSSKDTDLIKLGIENGGYFNKVFDILSDENLLLKNGILQDVKYCSLAIMNKLKMSKTNPSIMAQNIEDMVVRDIKANGYCNVFKIQSSAIKNPVC